MRHDRGHLCERAERVLALSPSPASATPKNTENTENTSGPITLAIRIQAGRQSLLHLAGFLVRVVVVLCAVAPWHDDMTLR